MEKENGHMVTKEEECFLFRDYHMLIGSDKDMCTIADHGHDVWITFKNIHVNSKKEVYYHLEVDKKSDFWKNLVQIINKIDANRD